MNLVAAVFDKPSDLAELVTSRIPAIPASLGGIFPFGLRRQTASRPFAIGLRAVPRHPNHRTILETGLHLPGVFPFRQLGVVTVDIFLDLPVVRLHIVQETGILRIRHFGPADPKSRQGDLVHRLLVRSALIASHHELSRGKQHHRHPVHFFRRQTRRLVARYRQKAGRHDCKQTHDSLFHDNSS